MPSSAMCMDQVCFSRRVVCSRGVTLEPTEEASVIAIECVVTGILIGPGGPLHNVLTIRPPRHLSEIDAGLLVSTPDRVFLKRRDHSSAKWVGLNFSRHSSREPGEVVTHAGLRFQLRN